MTRMTRPDCAVMCNLINTHTHTYDGQARWWSAERGKENKKTKSGSLPAPPSLPAATARINSTQEIKLNKTQDTYNKKNKKNKNNRWSERASGDASTCLGATQVSVRLGPVQGLKKNLHAYRLSGHPPVGSSARSFGVAPQILRFRVR